MSKTKCTVYIDESGDLGYNRGTRWFVLSAVIVDKSEESAIRSKMEQIKTRLNINEIHLRKIADFYKRAYVVRELDGVNFTYINVIADTSKLNLAMSSSASVAYNYICRMLLERASWFLRDTNREGDIILSARGTSRDGELIQYIKDKLIPYTGNQIVSGVFGNIIAKPASSWDMLQLADVCATTLFLTYEENGYGFCTPCFSKILRTHIYQRNGSFESYGLKYFDAGMKPLADELKCHWACVKKERTPSATTT